MLAPPAHPCCLTRTLRHRATVLRCDSTTRTVQMDDSVPYEGNGDANNHSEALNKTLDHAIMVRTHTFTAHRTHAPRTACTTVHSNGSGCSILACPKKPQPCPPYSLYCKPSLRCQPQRAARRPPPHPAPPAYPLRRQSCSAPASQSSLRHATSPPAYPLRHTTAHPLRRQPISSAPPAYLLHRQPILGVRFEKGRSAPLFHRVVPPPELPVFTHTQVIPRSRAVT